MDKERKLVKVGEMVLPSGKILEQFQDPTTGLGSMTIPAECREEYTQELVRLVRQSLIARW